MKHVRIPKLPHYRPRHRGGWRRGYDGPTSTAAPEKHTGATMKSPLPKAEVAAAGEDPLLAAQIEIHQEVTAEALEEERRRLELKEIEVRTRAELDAIFIPLQERNDDIFGRLFDRLEEWAGLGSGWVYGFYVDAVRRQAEAEEFARDVIKSDLHVTIAMDVTGFREGIDRARRALTAA